VTTETRAPAAVTGPLVRGPLEGANLIASLGRVHTMAQIVALSFRGYIFPPWPMRGLTKGHFTWRAQMGAGPNRLEFYQ
jgi:hypothetical protein